MKLQVLMATMNRGREDIIPLIAQSHLRADVLIINQCGRENQYELLNETQRINVVEVNEKGLSKSRNQAILHSDADICLIADDDMDYEEDLETLITEAFQANPEVDFIAFYIERSASFTEKSLGKRSTINKWSSLGLMSVQIAFRRRRVIEKNIHFDEDFGAGSGHYNSGEENIFLMDCLNNNMKMIYLPIKIGATIENESTWFAGYDALYFQSKGATFQRLFPKLAYSLILSFAFLKRDLYRENMTVKEAIKEMKKGRKDCKKMMRGRLV